MEYPLVSIGMPVFNGEKWVDRALDSLLKQDYPNIEIVISDNASLDNTLDIINKYDEQHKNISVIQNSINVGILNNFKK